MSDCKAYRHEIAEALDGALSRGASAHAESCRACGEELRGRQSVSALVRGLGKVEAPADFEYRLRARMAAGGGGGRRLRLSGLRLVYAFAPVAAAACFLVVSTALYLRQAASPAPAEAPTAGATEPARNSNVVQTAATPDSRLVEGLRPTGGRSVEVASAPPVFNARPAVHRQRAKSRTAGEDVDAVQRSATLSVTGARVITGSGVTIAMKTPLHVVLRDESGAGRVVPMRAVSFGSQELIARESVSRQAAVAENEGVW